MKARLLPWYFHFDSLATTSQTEKKSKKLKFIIHSPQILLFVISIINSSPNKSFFPYTKLKESFILSLSLSSS